jgi:hypothetical protein
MRLDPTVAKPAKIFLPLLGIGLAIPAGFYLAGQRDGELTTIFSSIGLFLLLFWLIGGYVASTLNRYNNQ